MEEEEGGQAEIERGKLSPSQLRDSESQQETNATLAYAAVVEEPVFSKMETSYDLWAEIKKSGAD